MKSIKPFLTVVFLVIAFTHLNIEAVADTCMMPTHPDYVNWVDEGKPDCWCYQYQHAGDIDGIVLYDFYPSSQNDLTAFISAFMKGPDDLPVEGICADLDHKPLYDYYPVSQDDLQIFVKYFMKPKESFPPKPNASHYAFYVTP